MAGKSMWIEFHVELWNHWKVNRMAEQLKIEYPHALGHLGCLWLWAAQQASDGNLKRFKDREIADAARWKGDEKTFKLALKNSRLLDSGGLLHDWSKHGLRLLLSSRKRLDKFRKSKAKEERLRNVSKTFQKRPSNPSNLSDLSNLSNPPQGEAGVHTDGGRIFFKAPTPEEVSLEGQLQGYRINAEQFIAHYATCGWKDAQGRQIVNWRSLVTSWKIRDQENPKGGKNGSHSGSAAPKFDEPRIVD